MDQKGMTAGHKLIPMISEREIRERTEQLAAAVFDHYQGKETVLVGVLKGALVFMADLMRRLSMNYECEFVQLSSYGREQESSGQIVLKSGPVQSIKGKHVLIIDCVADTGLTLDFLVKHLQKEGPADIRTCVLLNKSTRRRHPIHPDYVGFDIPDRFVVGYGLDYMEKDRGLPYIAYLDITKD
jgi:hypoxanthine phosphoribosyltransferase